MHKIKPILSHLYTNNVIENTFNIFYDLSLKIKKSNHLYIYQTYNYHVFIKNQC